VIQAVQSTPLQLTQPTPATQAENVILSSFVVDRRRTALYTETSNRQNSRFVSISFVVSGEISTVMAFNVTPQITVSFV